MSLEDADKFALRARHAQDFEQLGIGVLLAVRALSSEIANLQTEVDDLKERLAPKKLEDLIKRIAIQMRRHEL